MSEGFANIKGGEQLQAFLDQLPVKLERNVMRGALRAAANAVLPAAQANIQSHDGVLAGSLKVRTSGRGGRIVASVRTKVFYARFVEFGTKPHTITAKNRKGLSVGGLFFQSVEHPGARPRPFMRPAMDTQAQAAVNAAAAYVKDRLATKEGLDTSAVLLDGDE